MAITRYSIFDLNAPVVFGEKQPKVTSWEVCIPGPGDLRKALQMAIDAGNVHGAGRYAVVRTKDKSCGLAVFTVALSAGLVIR